jgi:phage tail-like protein
MPNYPMPVFHFQVDWGGTKIGFTEVSGLSVETAAIPYRDGASPEYNDLQMPGRQKYGPISLKRGSFQGDNEMFEWWNTVKLNTIERRDITISLLDENHSPKVTWRVKNAWPTKVEGPGLNSTSDEVAIETMELVHEGLTIEYV